jgi:tripartite-type tricarboxylate transporter receptor subunit TctC
MAGLAACPAAASLLNRIEDVMPTIRSAAFAVAAGLVATLAVPVPSTQAQQWPQRPVKFIVTLGAGSGIDIGTRLFADRLSKRWGHPAVVENRPGGDAQVAISAVLSANDDHVLLASPSSSFTAHTHMYKNLSYKPEDLVPIARISNTIIAMAVPASLDVKSLADFVALARAKTGELNYAGTTGTIDFLFAGFLKNANLNISKVPYRNQVEAANDLATGRIHINETAYAIVQPRVQAGTVKVVAITNSARAPVLPDIPTVNEAGFPDLNLDGLNGFLGPASMSMELRERIAADVRAVAAEDPVIAERLTLTGQIFNIGGPAEFHAAIEDQRSRVGKAAASLGSKPE